MKKPISFTWSFANDLPVINVWNYKGESICNFPVSNLPSSASKHLLGNDKRNTKANAKAFYEKHGITAVNVVKIVRGIAYNEILKQFPEWYKLSRTTSWIPSVWKFKYLDTEDLLQQCKKDGIENVIPIVAWYKKSPQELKKALGENQWKKFCKNSYSRNRLLFLKGNDSFSPVDWDTLPSTLLKARLANPPEVYEWLLRTQEIAFNRIIKHASSLHREVCTYLDTKSMCKSAGETFNPKWSKRRMKEEHDRLSRMQQQIANRKRAERDAEYAKLLTKDFREMHKGLEVTKFDSGVIATPLLNMQQVQDEGVKMKHCVGAYAIQCAEGEYLVWHLTKGATETTLGINVQSNSYLAATSKDKYNLQQHYGMCNAVVDDNDLKDAAKDIVKMLNEMNKE